MFMAQIWPYSYVKLNNTHLLQAQAVAKRPLALKKVMMPVTGPNITGPSSIRDVLQNTTVHTASAFPPATNGRPRAGDTPHDY